MKWFNTSVLCSIAATLTDTNWLKLLYYIMSILATIVFLINCYEQFIKKFRIEQKDERSVATKAE